MPQDGPGNRVRKQYGTPHSTLENDEIAQQVQKAAFLENALDQYLYLRVDSGHQSLARDRAPGVEPSGPVSLRKVSSRAADGKSGLNRATSTPSHSLNYHRAIVATLYTRCIGRDIGTVGDPPAGGFEPIEGGVFNSEFGINGHATNSSRAWSRTDHGIGCTS